MRTCIVGAGAIGGLIGHQLASAGVQVSLLARGATLAALRSSGLRKTGENAVPVQASDDAAALGAHDLVVVALKSQALPDVAPRLAPLLGPDTVVLSAMNGVPWWFFHDFGGACEGLALHSVDPGGAIARALPAARVLGCVVHIAAASPAPGVVQQKMGDRLILGEPSGMATPRLGAVAKLLRDAGFTIDIGAPIQRDVWFKLWGNMTMNPLSALTGATTDRLLDDPLLRAFASRCMEEARVIGSQIGLPIDSTTEARHELTRKLGAMKTSMLQDVEAGKPVELDALVSAVREIAQHLRIDTPSIDALLGLARVHARQRGLY